MYPQLFGILDSYMILIVIGIVFCAISFKRGCKRIGLTADEFKRCIYLAIPAVAVGAFSSSLVQSIYDYIATGEFVLFSRVTFYGGLLGGAIVFVVGGAIFFKGNLKDKFHDICNFAISSVILAHAFGRIGCFCDGCCYGIHTGTWLDVTFPNVPESVLPTQLYEAIFLFVLYFVTQKNINFALEIYCLGYGVFRFLIEFVRGDYRGALIPGLSPSQVISILLIITGIVLIILFNKERKNHGKNSQV